MVGAGFLDRFGLGAVGEGGVGEAPGKAVAVFGRDRNGLPLYTQQL